MTQRVKKDNFGQIWSGAGRIHGHHEIRGDRNVKDCPRRGWGSELGRWFLNRRAASECELLTQSCAYEWLAFSDTFSFITFPTWFQNQATEILTCPLPRACIEVLRAHHHHAVIQVHLGRECYSLRRIFDHRKHHMVVFGSLTNSNTKTSHNHISWNHGLLKRLFMHVRVQ